MKSAREIVIDNILEVAMAHHEDISKSDEDRACEAADRILSVLQSYYRIKLPEESNPSNSNCSDEWKSGYNHALADCRQAIGEDNLTKEER